MTQPSARHLAEIRSYGDLLAALRARADDLGVTREGLDAVTGLQNGYAGKLLAPVPIKSLGAVSMGPMLTAMGCMLILVEDAETLGRITSRVAKRVNPNPASHADGKMQTKRKRNRKGFRGSEVGRMLRARGVLKLSAKRRKEIARMAAQTRWRKHRAKSSLPPTGALPRETGMSRSNCGTRQTIIS